MHRLKESETNNKTSSIIKKLIMAKKTSSAAGEFSFEAFNDKLSKVPGMELGSIMETNTFSTITDYVDTGNYLLNAQISGSMFGGVADARSLGLVGDPECLCENQKVKIYRLKYMSSHDNTNSEI